MYILYISKLIPPGKKTLRNISNINILFEQTPRVITLLVHHIAGLKTMTKMETALSYHLGK